MTKRLLTTIYLLALAIGPMRAIAATPTPAVTPEPTPFALQTADITVGETPLIVELAVQIDEQARGLGYRDGLAEGTGMLFVGSQPTERTFWMKGMRFCLDIIWIENGQITGAAENTCPDPAGTADADKVRYPSGQPVTYVLEVPAGFLQEHGYGAGTPVDLSGLSMPTPAATPIASPVGTPAR